MCGWWPAEPSPTSDSSDSTAFQRYPTDNKRGFMGEVERHAYDVVVIGAGGAGLRAVIEARERGLSVAGVSKSLFGKAHTVMAEGGAAAATGTVNARDRRQGHCGD